VFQFSHNSAFYLLLLLPICLFAFWWYQRWRGVQLKKLGDYQLVQNMLKGESTKWVLTKMILLLLGLFLLIISLADPRSSGAQQNMKTISKEIVFALDLSNSMLATDVAPSRLEKAKLMIAKLLDTNMQDKVGLVVFAGNAYIAVPITIDVESIKMNLESVNPSMLPTQGTNISQAITRAAECFNTKREGGKAIVLITDGEDHEQGIKDAIQKCKSNNIKIITVGIGSPNGANIIDPETMQPKIDADGKEIISKLNEEELVSIAKEADGVYVPLQNMQDACNGINNSIRGMQATEENNESLLVYSHYFQWLLLPAILLIGFSIFYTAKTKYEKIFFNNFYITIGKFANRYSAIC
jgi:Ca-activated chloride channel homolog